jgi:hypothetical protein
MRKESVMIGKLKTLGLTLLALATIGAVSASSASAVTDVATTSASPALLTGVSLNNVFKGDPGNLKVECTTSKFAATVTNGSSLITADVAYEGTINQTPHEKHCNAAPAGTFTVDTAGCGYTINGETTGRDINGGTDATVWIECEGANVIQMTSSLGIIITVPSQTPTKGGVIFTNVANHAGNSAVKLTMTLTGITAFCDPAFTCGLAGIPTHSNAYEYTGDVTMTAFKDVEGLPTPVTEGERVSLTTS